MILFSGTNEAVSRNLSYVLYVLTVLYQYLAIKRGDKAVLGEFVSKELNHFGVIAGLFRQIGGHSSRFVLFCSF